LGNSSYAQAVSALALVTADALIWVTVPMRKLSALQRW